MSSFFCNDCLSRSDHFINQPVHELHHSISARLRAGFNLPASSSEVEQISAFLAEAPDTLAAYDNAIAEIDHLLLSLENARDALQRRYDSAQSFISSPIRTLPPEVLNEIFTICCQTEGTEEVYNLSLLEDPADAESRFWPALELSWVCSFWRTFVHSRPNLWSTLRISSKALDTPGVLEIFRKYILYSGDNLLDFRYDVPARSMENHIDGMGILLKNSTRWRRAILNIPSAPGAAGKWLRIFRMYQPSLADFPALEHLGALTPNGSQVLEFIHLFTPFPRLNTFSADHFSWSGLTVDLSHITELSLVSFTGKSFGHLLCRLPVLKILEVKGFLLSEDAEGDALLQGQRCYSSALSKLTVSSSTFQPEAWRFLRLPCLTDLGILTEDHPLSFVTSYLSSVLHDSHCTLQTFRVDGIPGRLQQALFNFMAPHHLSIVNLAINIEITRDLESFLQYLKPKEDGSCLAPNLRSLELGWKIWGVPRNEALCICKLIKARCLVDRVVSPSGTKVKMSGLQSLTLVVGPGSFRTTFPEFFRTNFPELEQAGFDVYLRYPSV